MVNILVKILIGFNVKFQNGKVEDESEVVEAYEVGKVGGKDDEDEEEHEDDEEEEDEEEEEEDDEEEEAYQNENIEEEEEDFNNALSSSSFPLLKSIQLLALRTHLGNAFETFQPTIIKSSCSSGLTIFMAMARSFLTLRLKP